MTDDAAELVAGRLLIRYGWPIDPGHGRRLPATNLESSNNRVMNDPEAQREAVQELREAHEQNAADLVELVRTRRMADASKYARQLVDFHTLTR